MEANRVLKQYIRNVVNECIQEEVEYRKTREMVKEEVTKLFFKKLNEYKDIDDKRITVMNMLKDDKYKNSSLAYELWNPKNEKEKDTYRSLFSKKANGTPDTDGNVRTFTDDEIVKLYELLRNT